jgi:hypothetical protein
VHLAGRTKVLAWFHLLSFFLGGYERTPIRQTTPYTRNIVGHVKTKPNHMQKLLTILILILLFGCSQISKNNSNDTDIYTAKKDFGKIDNRIPKSILDSLISVLPYWRLDDYKTTDVEESLAVEFLRNKLELKGLKPNEFLIYEIKKENDSVIVFHIDHVDSYVYRYNLDKTNSKLSKNPLPDGTIEEIPPMTGNVSGYEGWYRIDLGRKKLEVIYGQ